MTHRITVPILLGLLLACTPALWAHAKLLRSEPPAGAVVNIPPRAVRAWFNDELDPARSLLSVWDAGGRRVDDRHGGVDLDDLDRRSMAARLRVIGNGIYTVRWRAVSADDGFVTEGSFKFTVRR